MVKGWLSGSVLLFSCMMSLSCFSQDELVFYAVNYPPYLLVNDRNQVSGMDVDVVSAAFDVVGQPVEFDVLPWKRIMKLMKNGEIAGSMSCSQRKSRLEYMLFSEPVSITRQAAITHKEMDTSSIHKLADLKRYSVTTIQGWGSETKLIKQGIPHTVTKDLRSSLVSVLYRGVDVFYGPEFPTRYRAKNMGEKPHIKATYLEDIPSHNLHLCVSKAYPNSAEIVRSFNQGLAVIKQNGTYQRIQDKYF